ncbi:hypothetical protein ACA910_009564 [Epithemia clementina (nom. ined.)]
MLENHDHKASFPAATLPLVLIRDLDDHVVFTKNVSRLQPDPTNTPTASPSNSPCSSVCPHDQKGESSSPSPSHCKRVVRFDEDNICYHDDPFRTCSSHNNNYYDCYDTWYSASEYRAIQAQVKRVLLDAKKSLKREEQENSRRRHGGDASINTKSILRELMDLTSQVNYGLRSVSKLVTPSVHQKLELLYQYELQNDQYEDSWIGLESFLQPYLQEEALQRMESINEVVSDIQAEYNYHLWSDAEVETELCDSCRNFSQALGLLAQFLAMAQHMAATTPETIISPTQQQAQRFSACTA